MDASNGALEPFLSLQPVHELAQTRVPLSGGLRGLGRLESNSSGSSDAVDGEESVNGSNRAPVTICDPFHALTHLQVSLLEPIFGQNVGKDRVRRPNFQPCFMK